MIRHPPRSTLTETLFPYTTLFRSVALRDEQREGAVVGPGLLDADVERRLHPLPDPVAVRPDDHRAPGRTVLGHLSLGHDVLVPTREVVGLRGEDRSLRHSEPIVRDAAGPAPTGTRWRQRVARRMVADTISRGWIDRHACGNGLTAVGQKTS